MQVNYSKIKDNLMRRIMIQQKTGTRLCSLMLKIQANPYQKYFILNKHAKYQIIHQI